MLLCSRFLVQENLFKWFLTRFWEISLSKSSSRPLVKGAVSRFVGRSRVWACRCWGIAGNPDSKCGAILHRVAAKRSRASGFRKGLPCPNKVRRGSSWARRWMFSRLRAASSVNILKGSFSPGCVVTTFMLVRTSPMIKTRSDSRQKEICPRACPGVSSTSKPFKSSPARSARLTWCAGPAQNWRCNPVITLLGLLWCIATAPISMISTSLV